MKTLLWVDDDISASLDAFSDELKEAGYNIIGAKTPEEMWDKLKSNNINGIILDIMMPTGEKITKEESQMGVKTGFVLAKKLRDEKSEYKNIPLIIFTILNDSDISLWASENNIPFLVKQYTLPHELLEVMEKFGIEK